MYVIACIVWLVYGMASLSDCAQDDKLPKAWTFNVRDGQNQTINCNDNATHTKDKWSQSEYHAEWFLPNNNKAPNEMISSNGFELHVTNVKSGDYGWYKCVVYNSSNVVVGVILYGLNLSGKVYKDIWQEYEDNVIIAAIAAGVILVLTTSCCILYKFRFKDHDYYNERENRIQKNLSYYATNGISNKAMDDEVASTSAASNGMAEIPPPPPGMTSTSNEMKTAL